MKEVLTYVSDDGKSFTSAKVCLEHEAAVRVAVAADREKRAVYYALKEAQRAYVEDSPAPTLGTVVEALVAYLEWRGHESATFSLVSQRALDTTRDTRFRSTTRYDAPAIIRLTHFSDYWPSYIKCTCHAVVGDHIIDTWMAPLSTILEMLMDPQDGRIHYLNP